MNWFTGVCTYVIIWWLVLFTVLPWGNRAPDTPEPGHVPSAPEKPRLVIKFAVTTAIATVAFVVVYAIVESGWIAVRGF